MNSAKIPLAAAALVARFTGAGFLFAASRIGGRCPCGGYGVSAGSGALAAAVVRRCAVRVKRVGGSGFSPAAESAVRCFRASALVCPRPRCDGMLFFSKKLNLGIDFCAKIVYTVHGKQNGDGFPPLSLTPIVSLD